VGKDFPCQVSALKVNKLRRVMRLFRAHLTLHWVQVRLRIHAIQLFHFVHISAIILVLYLPAVVNRPGFLLISG